MRKVIKRNLGSEEDYGQLFTLSSLIIVECLSVVSIVICPSVVLTIICLSVVLASRLIFQQALL